ncbi:MAG: hypothetical protein ACOYBP_08695 [Microbacteriaceae bacterium]
MTESPEEFSDEYYEDFSRRIEAGEFDGKWQLVQRGEGIRDEVFEHMAAATGQDNWDDIARVALGRPRLEEHRQQPVIKLRLGTNLARELDNYLEAHPGENKSHVVRSALAQYIKSA